LHSAFVRDALCTLGELTGVDLELSTDEPCEDWVEFPIPRSTQRPGDLGERILGALFRGLDEGRPKVVVIGSDSPGLPASHIGSLLASRADVCFGPADDGGFYAIACARPDARMFAGVRWSSASTLQDAVRAAKACRLSVAMGPAWFDVDRPEDLERLRALPELRPALRRTLMRCRERFIA
jgi:glycosyltransferase A (GT-A) superfamily protein (DUF2064 family)